MAGPVAHGDVHVLAGEVGEAHVGVDAKLDLGMSGAEAPEARHQPPGGDRGQQAHGERAPGVVDAQALGRRVDAIEGVAQVGEVLLTCVG